MIDNSAMLEQAMYELNEHVLDEVSESLEADPFVQQKLFEKWIREEHWCLRSQALPLTLGVDPDGFYDTVQKAAYKELELTVWTILQSLVQTNDGPLVINPEAAAESWAVRPADYYRWLDKKGISVPDSLDSLMQFVMSVVQKPSIENQIDTTVKMTELPSDKEQLFVAAINILSKEPNACRNDSGITDAAALAEMIASQSVIWFDQPKPKLSIEKMTLLLEECLT